MSSNKNAMGLFITFSIALFIAWFLWGDATRHIWTAWLFVVLLLIGMLFHTMMMYNRIADETFDGVFLFNVICIVVFDLLFLGQIDYIGRSAFTIISYIITGILALSVIFGAVRYFQHQSES